MTGVEQQVQRVKNSLRAIELGMYSEFTIDYCCNYISWLYRFKKVPRSVWEPLCDQATRILQSYC